MSAAIVYSEWWWTCDECGEYAPEAYDTETDAERAADAHECKATQTATTMPCA